MRALVIAIIVGGALGGASAEEPRPAPIGGSVAALRESMGGTYRAVDRVMARLTPVMRARLQRIRPNLDHPKFKVTSTVYDHGVHHVIVEQDQDTTGWRMRHDRATIDLVQRDEDIMGGLSAVRDGRGHRLAWERGHFNLFAPLGATSVAIREKWYETKPDFESPYKNVSLLFRTETAVGKDHVLVEKMSLKVDEGPRGAGPLAIVYTVREHAQSGKALGPAHRYTLTLPAVEERMQARDLVLQSVSSGNGAPDQGYYGVLAKVRAHVREAASGDPEHPLRRLPAPE
jgi:hypothetical protein